MLLIWIFGQRCQQIANSLQHPKANGDDQSAFFSNGNERVWRNQGLTKRLPTQKGFGSDFYATIAPHGVIELTSIQIAGAAGLLLAQAIVMPGRLRRIDALKANARRAGTLMIGVAGLLCIAGTIEGFVTPQRTTEIFRFGFGAVTAVALIAYFGLCGREPRSGVTLASGDEIEA